MHYNKSSAEDQKNYVKKLQMITSLTRLFSDSDVPYLYYRVAERIYCESLGAEDLSRGDITVDAVITHHNTRYGVGLKTFLHNNGRTFQKIAEFNRDRDSYAYLSGLELAKHISSLRNTRINFANKSCDIDDNFYHCVLREQGKLHIFEEPMSLIDIEKIKIIKDKGNSLLFTDGYHEYNFNKSKSTLLKRFECPDSTLIASIDTPILDDPFRYLAGIRPEEEVTVTTTNHEEHVFLPLYSTRGRRHVPKRSGLNQWNAAGRTRDENELYISVPKEVHRQHPDFFPPKDVSFDLKLPNGKNLSAKLCQAGSKALMSNPNKELGRWILRDILSIPDGELATIEMLDQLDIDSVRVTKHNIDQYSIDFSCVGSFEDFISE